MALEHYAQALAYDPSLSFASNNPHIIDNPLFSEALIMSQRYLGKTSARVPRQYGDANRIVDLMLEGEDEEEGGGDEEESEDEEEGSEEVDEAPLAGGSPRDANPGSRAASQPLPRTSTGSSPSRTSVPPPSQVRAGTRVVQPSAPRDPRASDTAPGTTSDGRTVTAVPRRVAPQAASPQTRSTRVPTTQVQPSEDGRAATGRAASGRGETDSSGRPTTQRTSPSDRSSQAAPPPRSSRYIPPSRRSSAQLELRLLPAEADSRG